MFRFDHFNFCCQFGRNCIYVISFQILLFRFDFVHIREPRVRCRYRSLANACISHVQMIRAVSERADE